MIRLLLALLALCLGQAAAGQPPAAPAQVYDYRVVATYPHDPGAFTQGLFYLDGQLFESTGQVGQSTIRRVRIEDGQVLQQVAIPAGQFGEGIVNWQSEIVSLTWTDGIGYRWDRATLRRRGDWRYAGEGWGLTQNGTDIIMSDGTAELRFLDPATLAERRRVTVTHQGQRVEALNELEWIGGAIFANIWRTGYIVRIDPASGLVTGIVDLRPLAAQHAGADTDQVLNGIAYDAGRDRLFVTGKYWPSLYEIDLVPRPAAPAAPAAQ
jgi:glutaminyl-peptide cyclotransferase